jgi:hypothetical protein
MMKKIAIIIIMLFVSAVLFSQEVVHIDGMLTENKKYAVMYYYYKTYNDENYISEFKNNIIPLDEESRANILLAYKTYKDNDVIYYFSGPYIDYFLHAEAGECLLEIRLTDSLTGNEELDELITDLTSTAEKFNSQEALHKPLTESGEDENGKYKIEKRWEIGKADFFLDSFRKTYWNLFAAFLDIEHPYLYD